jgi:hypothetical protein
MTETRLANSLRNGDPRNKRNAFQKALDRKTTIEFLSAGKTYTFIARHISDNRAYSITPEQLRADMTGLQEVMIAEAMSHGLEAIAEELDKIENLMVDISRRLQQFRDGDKGAAPFLKLMADLCARKTHLKGGENFIKAQDLNQAIERVTRAGFVVSDPLESREEPIDVESEELGEEQMNC